MGTSENRPSVTEGNPVGRRCPRSPLPAAYREYASVGALRAPRIWTVLRGPWKFQFLEVAL